MLQPNAAIAGCDPLLHLRRLSRELLNLSQATNDTSTIQEAYLCFAILNWFTPARSRDSLDIKGLGNVLENWEETHSPVTYSQKGQEKRLHIKPTKVHVLLNIGVEKGSKRIWLENLPKELTWNGLKASLLTMANT